MHARSRVIPSLRAIPSFHANAREAKGFDANAWDHVQYRRMPTPHAKLREPFHSGVCLLSPHIHLVLYVNTLCLVSGRHCMLSLTHTVAWCVQYYE